MESCFVILGCVPQNRLNGMDLDQEDSPVMAQRQNVVFGCPCEKGDCANNGSCVVNATTPLVNVCKCVGTWSGLRCEKETPPERGAAPREYFSYCKRTKERKYVQTNGFTETGNHERTSGEQSND